MDPLPPTPPVIPPRGTVVQETLIERPVLPIRNRVQWGPIVAGVLVSIVVFLLMTVLGIALGASVLDPANTAGEIGTWAAIWGAVTAIVAFGVGGWIAARAAAVEGTFAGLINGFSVGVAGLLLIIWLTASGLGNLFGTIGSTVGGVINVAASTVPAATEAVGANVDQQQAEQAVQDAGQEVEQATGVDVQNPQAAATAVAGQIEQVADQAEERLAQADSPETFEAVRNGAFGTLVALIVPLLASAAGGFLGRHERVDLIS